MIEERKIIMKKGEIIKEAIETYGKDAQIFVAIEEMAELMKALSKEKRNRDADGRTQIEDYRSIADEIADVQIMLDQLRIIFGLNTSGIENGKLERLKKRIKGEKNEVRKSIRRRGDVLLGGGALRHRARLELGD